MALPGSGQLSLGDIAGELGVSLSNVSLRSMSSTAGFSTPDSVSEFYGYSGVTYSYYATWALDDPCNYDYYDIYSGSDGAYYVDNGGYQLMYGFAPGTVWYEYLYYDKNFAKNVYNGWSVDATSTTLTDEGLALSTC